MSNKLLVEATLIIPKGITAIMEDLKLIDKKTLAKIVNRSVRTVERWNRAGMLPPTNPVLPTPTWTMTQISTWLRQIATNSDTDKDSD